MTAVPTIAAIRFGFGLSPEQPPPADAAAILAALAGPDTAAQAWPLKSFADVMPMMAEEQPLRKANREDQPGAKDALTAYVQAVAAEVAADFSRTLQRAVQSPDGFRERLMAFWSNHFTVTAKNGVGQRLGPTAYAEDALRPNMTGPFRTLLRAAVTHPVMLVYLDQNRSIGPDSPFGEKKDKGLNENLAREVLELHTLGVGASYTQTDVRQFAKLLTGLGYSPKEGFVFHPQWAQPGAETVLGKSYGGEEPAQLSDILAALDDIAAHPETRAHISRKLAVHFVSDTPDPDLLRHMEAAWTASDGDLGKVYAAMLEHPAAWSPDFAKVRMPFDYIATGLRGLGLPATVLDSAPRPIVNQTLMLPLRQMGQPFQGALGPNGWHEDAGAWITPQGLAARIQWAMSAPSRLMSDLPDPRALVQTALADAAPADLVTAVARAESPREGVGILLASPQFNRR